MNVQVIDDSSLVSKHYSQLGRHFASVKDYKLAEQLFSQAGLYRDAIEMYINAGNTNYILYSFTTTTFLTNNVKAKFIKTKLDCPNWV